MFNCETHMINQVLLGQVATQDLIIFTECHKKACIVHIWITASCLHNTMCECMWKIEDLPNGLICKARTFKLIKRVSGL